MSPLAFEEAIHKTMRFPVQAAEVRRLAKDTNLSINELHRKTGINHTRMHRLANGLVRMDIGELARLRLVGPCFSEEILSKILKEASSVPRRVNKINSIESKGQ